MAVSLKPGTVRNTLGSKVFASAAMCGARCMRRVPCRRAGRGFPAGSANVMAYGASVVPCALRTSPPAGGSAAGGFESLRPSKLGRCPSLIRLATPQVGLDVPQSKQDVGLDWHPSASSSDTTSPRRIAWPAGKSPGPQGNNVMSRGIRRRLRGRSLGLCRVPPPLQQV